MEKARAKLEEDGIELDVPEHWETWEGMLYIYPCSKTATWNTYIHVPIAIIRHLKLTHKRKIKIAIKLLP
jgi:hypothetical protein